MDEELVLEPSEDYLQEEMWYRARNGQRPDVLAEIAESPRFMWNQKVVLVIYLITKHEEASEVLPTDLVKAFSALAEVMDKNSENNGSDPLVS